MSSSLALDQQKAGGHGLTLHLTWWGREVPAFPKLGFLTDPGVCSVAHLMAGWGLPSDRAELCLCRSYARRDGGLLVIVLGS